MASTTDGLVTRTRMIGALTALVGKATAEKLLRYADSDLGWDRISSDFGNVHVERIATKAGIRYRLTVSK